MLMSRPVAWMLCLCLWKWKGFKTRTVCLTCDSQNPVWHFPSDIQQRHLLLPLARPVLNVHLPFHDLVLTLAWFSGWCSTASKWAVSVCIVSFISLKIPFFYRIRGYGRQIVFAAGSIKPAHRVLDCLCWWWFGNQAHSASPKWALPVVKSGAW